MKAKLARIPNMHSDGTTDDCVVQVLAEAKGGSARTLVRCLFTRETAHVHPVAVRSL